jgi:invasion protein IalB
MKKQLGITLLVTILFGSTVQAASPQVLGEYGNWTAYHYRDGRGSVCYMMSKPVKDEGKYSKRGDIYAVVTHRPGDKTFDVVNFDAGYTFKNGAPYSVKIGHNTVTSFFTEGQKAWTLDEKTDKQMVALMKAGERMIVNGVSYKGTKTKDTYSLKGFTGAYKAISAKCKR